SDRFFGASAESAPIRKDREQVLRVANKTTAHPPGECSLRLLAALNRRHVDQQWREHMQNDSGAEVRQQRHLHAAHAFIDP
ncbi:hypothetical protein, partial [Xanthomonas fragariae]